MRTATTRSRVLLCAALLTTACSAPRFRNTHEHVRSAEPSAVTELPRLDAADLAAPVAPAPAGRNVAETVALDVGPIPGWFDATTALAAGGDAADEPQRRRRRSRTERRERRFAGYVMVSGGSGDYEIRDDVLGKDESHATLVRVQAGGGNRRGAGGGIDFKLFNPGDDFYENSINVTSLKHVDLYGFFQANKAADAMRMAIRIGPYLSTQAAEFQVSGDDTDYSSVGIRVEFEPEIVLADDSDFGASLFGRFSAGAHTTVIDDESTDEEYDSSGHSLGLEGGIRFVFDNLALSGSYIYNKNVTRESDRERGLVIPRFETEFTGVQISFGVRF